MPLPVPEGMAMRRPGAAIRGGELYRDIKSINRPFFGQLVETTPQIADST